MIDSTYLEKAVDYFKKRPDTKLVYCEADRFGQKEKYWYLPQYTYEDEIWRNCIFCSSVYKRADYDKTVGYNPKMKGGGFEVAYVQWKLLQPFRVLLESYPLERILSNYHLMHEADISKMVELIQEEL